MADFLFTYLRIGLMGSVMILAVLLLRPLLCKAPRKISCVLWLLVFLRLLLPFQLESPLSLQPQQLTETAPLTDSAEELPVSDPTPEMDWTPSDPVTELSPVTPSAPIQTEAPIAETPIQPKTILSIVWIFGFFAIAVYVCISYGVLHYRVRYAVKTPDNVWESDRINSAFLLGYFKPRIYLPVGLPHSDRSFILAHENAHRQRCDHWWKLLGMLCLSIHWYNPLIWLAYALLCRDIEVACDQQVIRTMELDQRKSYSFALLNSGKRLSGFLAYPVAFGEISLKSRVKNVLNYRKPTLWISLGAILVATVIALCFMTNPPEADTVSVPETSATEPSVTAPTEEPTVPTTEPTTAPTEPVTTTTTEPITEPVSEPTTSTTAPTEPATEPTPTEPKPTEPKPTQPKPTETAPAGPQTIAEGKWLGRTYWDITSEGVLTLTGTRHIDGASYVDDYPWMQHKKQVTKIVVGEGLTTLPSHIFEGMTRVTEVSLPSTLEEINYSAFRECSSLKSITIPAKVQTLEPEVFFLCTSLRSISFEEGTCLTTIKGSALEATALTEFHAPSTLKTIEKGAFAGCTALKILDLWNANASVHHEAFNECSAIKQVLLGSGSYISQYTYPNWYQVETAKLYSDFHEFFSKRTYLHSVEIGGNVTEIPFNAFRDCTALSKVTINSSITSVEMNAFMNCSALTALTLPDTVTEISAHALSGTGIKTFTVPASVKKLGQSVFKNSALEQITFLGDAPRIGDYAFEGVTATAYYPADNETWTQDKLQNYSGNITWVSVP